MKAYRSGEYEAAKAQFLSLAELGDGASQFNLGAMALQGQAGAKDLGTGVGWLLAAAENGYENMTPEKLAALKSSLSPDQLRVAQNVVDRYGRPALLSSVLPPKSFYAYCSQIVPAKVLKTFIPAYPVTPKGVRRTGS